jgi:hypothetical protein
MGDSNENVIKDFSHVAVDTEGKVKVKKEYVYQKNYGSQHAF